MERSEPTLVPEWLKTAGSSTVGGSTSHLDDHAASKVARNKSFVNSNGHDLGRSSSFERTTSSYFRRGSSSNSSGNLRSYSSFGRNQRDRHWEKDAYDSLDQDKSVLGDRRHRDFSDTPGNTLLGKFERDGLRRSQSMISGKRGDTWSKKVVTDSTTASGKNTSGFLTKSSPVGVVNRESFKRDFPSLGAEDREFPEVGRVPSPGLSTAIQSLPLGTSTSIGGEKWTSALAEVPMLVGSNGSALSSVQQAIPSSSASVAVGSTSSLNMAEAVAQGPSRAQTTPQVLNSSDKQKSKVGQPHHPLSSSVTVNHSPRGGPVKGDFSKASNVGKLQVLKTVREKNGAIPVVKDNLSPTSGAKAVSSTLADSSSVSGPAVTRGPPNNAVPDRKPVLTVLEKRPTSQAQSRNDFFNLVRKKSMTSPNSASDMAMPNSPSVLDTGTEVEVMPATNTQAVDVPASLNLSVGHLSEEKADVACNGDPKYVSNGMEHPSSDPIIPEEEEAAFLRSLGWEENDDEGGLTEEEINAFYKDLSKYINSKPFPKILQGGQLKFLLPFDSQIGGIGGISSGLRSSDAKLES
ncbi:hypothetical protein CDL12_16845 [Handroanthus impetiginosus]|uniref:Uncharacterized protein n=1 Tax=Handroanthus impetiginosus TaxID=429701 RepID=A0A2G9GZX3_9LAMI|nr:hypothetical protein CDL12_16845 [Handroanthus impetiginosus]